MSNFERDDEIKSILASLPGFKDYQERFADLDLERLLTKYELSLKQSNKLSFGIRTNINLIKRWYNEQNSSSNDSQEKIKDKGEVPAWAACTRRSMFSQFERQNSVS